MSSKKLRVLFALIILVGMFTVTLRAQSTTTAQFDQTEAGLNVESQLLDQIEKNGSAGYLIYFRNEVDLSAASSMDWEERGYYVMNTLQQAADKAQANVRAYLDSQGVKYQSFWIDNIISVDDSGVSVFKDLQNFSEIESLRAHRTMGLIEPEEKLTEPFSIPFAIEPNITHVGAPSAWALGINGTGMVVASIDTGVRYTHQALVNQYRGNLGSGSFNHNYNWWDPYGDHPTTPADDNGHGTHTMGTMVGNDGGANQIGMAPGAKWIACRACNTSSCSDTALLSCAQFMVAPTNLSGGSADPSKRPNAINNSWGDCGMSYDNWYQGVVNSWHAAGIYPLFSNGNSSNCGYSSPPACGTVGNPARYGNVTGVGSTGQSNGAYASHSNRGPTDNADTINPNGFPTIKPQVAAPGVDIRSSVNDSDTAYEGGWSGTSMSAPHVTGLIALIWQAAPCLVGDYAATETLIQNTATHITTGLPGSCSGEGPGQYPNQSTGYGEINALAAVNEAFSACGPQGSLSGTVTAAAGGAPIEEADIEAVGIVNRTTQTAADGTYLFSSLDVGSYNVTASKFGYLPNTVTGVEVVAGALTTRDFALTLAPTTLVHGIVKDATTGWPLYAQITIGGTPLDPIWTDPATGAYSVVLPRGNAYTLTTTAWVPGYLPTDTIVNTSGSDMQVNINLTANGMTCIAPGYVTNFSGLLTENFDSVTSPALPAGWAVVDVNGTTGDWKTSTATVHPSGVLPHSGLNLAYFNSYNASSSASTRLYRTADLNLSSSGNTSMILWMYHDTSYSSSADRLQVQVSTDSGVNWNNVGTAINRYDGTTGWKKHIVDLSAYNGLSAVRIGLLGISAYGNDVHIDDVEVGNLTCTPTAGGLVVGEVLDENTSLGLPGAIVSNLLGGTATAQTTADPNVGDAFYSIFAPQGSTTLIANPSASQYGSDTWNPTISNGSTTWHDFALPAGLLSASPSPLTGTAMMGSSTTVPLTLVNNGGFPLTYKLLEKDLGFVPMAGEDVLVVRYNTSIANAVQASLTANGFTFLGITDTTFQGMSIDQLLEYQAVFYCGNPGVNGASENKMMAYLDAGGQLFITDNDLGYSRRSASNTFYNTYLQATYHADNGGELLTGEDLMLGLNPDVTNDPYPDDFTVGAEGTRIFKYSTSDFAGGIIVDRAGYKAIYFSADFNFITSTADRNELVNRIMDEFALDVPWLSENPTSGTLDAYASVTINVTMDATSLGTPGTYLAELRTPNNTPYGIVTVPVEFTVLPLPSLGKLEGTVSTSGYCDSSPGALLSVPVTVNSASFSEPLVLQTDENGYYYAWLDQSVSPLSLSVNAGADYATGSATGVILTGGQTTTQDFSLTWLKPCASPEPTSMEVVVPVGKSRTEPLTISNDGAGVLDFTFKEKPGTPLSGIWAKPIIFDIGDAWETMSPLPSARVFNAVIADDNGYIYVMGGTSDAAGASPTNTNYRYNTATNTWDSMAVIPASVDSIDGIFINGKIYIPGDGNTADTFVYDVAENTWSTITANGGYTAREQYQVVAIDNNLYVLGGITASASTTQVWVLNTQTETWSPGVPMQKSRTAFSAEAIDGEIYVAGGVLFPGFTPDMTAEKFNGTAWSFIAQVPDGAGAYTRWSYNADGLGANVLWLAAGRRDADWNILNHAGFYDPATDIWTTSPTIPTLSQGRVYMEGAVATDGYFYVIGGRSSDAANVYDTNERLMVGISSSDVPWLSENPIDGTIPAYSTDDYDITFSAMPTLTLGTHTAALNIVSNDPVNSNISVPVTMNIVTVGVELSPASAAKTGGPGTTVNYNFTVTNSGSYTDTFNVGITSVWAVDAPTTVGPVAAGASKSFVVSIQVPSSAQSGASDTAVVKVTSQIDPSVFAQATGKTTAKVVYGIEVTPLEDAKTGLAGTIVTYNLTVKNIGNTADTYDVAVSGQTWSTIAPITVGPLAAGASQTINVTVTIPADAADGDWDIATITFTSQGDDTKSVSAELTTTAKMDFWNIFLPIIVKN